MHLRLCLCALIPRLQTRTRVVLVLHQLEMHKTSNTGQLAIACLENAATVVRGGPDAPGRGWRDATQPVLLFPHPDARPLSDWRGSAQPVTLIVPDGTWSQAIRARKRLPGLLDMPCATLPPAEPSHYRLRTEVRHGHLATLEAIARALEVLEDDGAAVRERMEKLCTIMVERTLWASGRLTEAEVTGGIPADAQRHDPAQQAGPARSPRG
jgi:DTW domain-containing protein YfiP